MLALKNKVNLDYIVSSCSGLSRYLFLDLHTKDVDESTVSVYIHDRHTEDVDESIMRVYTHVTSILRT